MPLLNYTTQVAAMKTVAEVQAKLAKAGAMETATSYVEGRPVAVMFRAPTPFGPREYELPVDRDKVLAVLKQQPKVPARYVNPDQAERIAWRILKDWVEAQLAIIETAMVTIDQVMLPYMRTDDGRTVFDRYRSNQFTLTGGSDEHR
jgi:hypothetical protein